MQGRLGHFMVQLGAALCCRKSGLLFAKQATKTAEAAEISEDAT